MRKLLNRKTMTVVSGFLVALVLVLTAYVISNNYASKKAAAGSSTYDNSVMLQGFEWFLEDYGLEEENGADVETLWEFYAKNAQAISDAGITSIWLPPAFKTDNLTAGNTQGYEPYDLYDLGEFYQKGRTETKYGSKDQYLAAINALHKADIKVFADIILGHKTGADSYDSNVRVNQMDWNNRNTVVGSTNINAWTNFKFEGRNGKYSTFKWNKSHFDACTLDGNLYMFDGKSWDSILSTDYQVDDYLMFLDCDLDNSEVVNEFKTWGKWYVDFCDLDGFRIDAVKHMDYDFVKDFLSTLKSTTGKDLYSVGEYFDTDTSELTNYISKTSGETDLFDMPLRYNMMHASREGSSFDLRKLYDGTLTKAAPDYSVTFIDNHDEQNGRFTMGTTSLKNEHVLKTFKPQAYAAILTRQEGYPCVFYGDYYGTDYESSIQDELNELLYARKTYAYGNQNDYFFNSNCIGWSREGDSSVEDSGLATLISDYAGSSTYSCEMYVGKDNAGEIWIDYTGNTSGYVVIDNDGYATFTCNGGSYAVWVKADAEKTAEIEKAMSSNNITIYYKSSWTKTYIHYRVDSGSWTTVPGKLMDSTNLSGYYSFTTTLGTGKKLEFCFNNGGNSWNNNSNNNFKLSKGIYTISGTSVTSGAPNGLVIASDPTEAPTVEPTVVPTIAPTETPTETPTVAPTVEPTVAPTVAPTEAPTVEPTEASKNLVTIYYYSGWSNSNIHYKLGNSSWTTVPGVAMEKYNSKYYVITIDLEDASKITFCFNNGSSWDSHNGSNYTISSTGNYIVRSGSVYAGTP